jgi:hypothetical protein
MVYFYSHSLMTYGLIFWGNSYHSNTVFIPEKRIIRIMVGIRDRQTCREYFRKLKVLPFYYHSISLFWVIELTLQFNVFSCEAPVYNSQLQSLLHTCANYLFVFYVHNFIKIQTHYLCCNQVLKALTQNLLLECSLTSVFTRRTLHLLSGGCDILYIPNTFLSSS